MCKWGTVELVTVMIPADLSHTGVAYQKLVGVDACIAPLVRALNNAGIPTRACCCGHGKGQGRIDLHDGRVLFIDRTQWNAEGIVVENL